MKEQLIIGFVVGGIILVLLFRYILMCLSIKKNSQLFSELKNLNSKYIVLFQIFQKKIKINYICNSLQQYRNNCNKIAITNYMCGRIRENEDTWKEIYSKANSNKNNYKSYLDEYKLISRNNAGQSYKNIKKKTFLFSEKQYLKFEEKYCQRKMLKPITSLHIIVNISYTSPTGKNSYSSECVLINESVDELFTRIEDKKVSERSIDYQRVLMTSGKRYDILRRDGYKCQICGRGQSDGAQLEIDHIIPVSKGGQTVDENLQTLCHECNQGKKAKI